jgi:hypothetical protein
MTDQPATSMRWPPDMIDPANWEIDLDLPLREFDQFAVIFNKTLTGQSQDDEVLAFMVRVVKRWPFALSPADHASYAELRLSEWRALIRMLIAAFREVQFQYPYV